MLVCITAGFLCGRTTLRRSLNWCRAHIDDLRKYMPLENGIASPSTASRMLGGIDEELFRYAFMEWIGEIVDSKNTQIAVDGKALRAATEKSKPSSRVPMVLNIIETVHGLVLGQIPIDGKGNEITAIPEALRLLDIRGSTVTIDAIGTQTAFMEQIHGQGGHFLFTVKKNQPEAHDEIHGFMGRLANAAEAGAGEKADSVLAEYLKQYDKTDVSEKNRDRYEYRTFRVCNNASELTKAQEEWRHVRCIGLVEQIRIPLERDGEGNDVTPSREEFLKKGSRREPSPVEVEGAGKSVQRVAVVSDRHLAADEMGRIKRAHWAIENKLHHVLDDTFREDRSPARGSKNNLSLIRKFVYNILRLARLELEEAIPMTEMMDSFCDNAFLCEKYIFKGIASLY